jgi:poly(A) polymerase
VSVMTLDPPPDWLRSSAISVLFEVLGVAHLRAVGGCVRDHLLGVPVQDVDMATSHRPEEVMGRLRKAGIRVIPTGLAHGTVTALVEGIPFEITTLRTDQACDGRHAEVQFTDSWEQDAARRDFTLNALYLDASGHLYDDVGGYADLQARRVRFIGDARARIREDYLRILRYFRFYARFDTGEGCSQAREACLLEAEGIARLSGERICAEMFKLLSLPRAAEAVQGMQQAGLNPWVWGGEVAVEALRALRGLEKGVAPESRILNPELTRSLAGLLLSSQQQAWLETRWKWSRTVGERLRQVEMLSHFVSTSEDFRPLVRRHGAECVVDALLVAKARSGVSALPSHDLQWIHDAYNWPVPVFPVTGAMLIARGMKPGPELGKTLASMEQAWEGGGYIADADTLLAEWMPH